MRSGHVYDPGTGQLVAFSNASAAQLNSVAEAEFGALAAHHAREKARLDKQSQRLVLLTRGYEERAAALNRGISAAAADRVDEQIKLSCFAALAAGEEVALPTRLQAAHAAMSDAVAQERQLQARYSAKLREIDGLRLRLMSAGIEAASASNFLKF